MKDVINMLVIFPLSQLNVAVADCLMGKAIAEVFLGIDL